MPRAARVVRVEDLQEGAREVLVTLLATIAFGLGWAAVEAGRANSALARDGIPTATAVEAEPARETGAGPAPMVVAWAEAASGEETGYPRPRMERR